MNTSEYNELELWKSIPDTVGYEASNLGRIRSNRGPLKPQAHALGYQIVGVRFVAGRKSATVHSLVAAAHIGPRPTGLVIAHLNHDKQDNRATNLAYMTFRENIAANFEVGGPLARKGGWRSVEIGECFSYVSERMKPAAIRKHCRDQGRKYGKTYVYCHEAQTVTRLADPNTTAGPKKRPVGGVLTRALQFLRMRPIQASRGI